MGCRKLDTYFYTILAEQAPDWTPYRYGFNNPIKYIDPDGMFEQSGSCCIPREVMEFGNYLSNLVSDIFGLKPKKNKSETKKEKGLNLEVWGNNTNGDGIKGLEKSRDGSETLSVDMSQFTGMSNLGKKFENMFNLLSVASKLIVNKLFDKNSPYFSDDTDETHDNNMKLINQRDEKIWIKIKRIKHVSKPDWQNGLRIMVDPLVDTLVFRRDSLKSKNNNESQINNDLRK